MKQRYLPVLVGLAISVLSLGCSNGGTKGGFIIGPVPAVKNFQASKGFAPVVLSWETPPTGAATIIIRYSTANPVVSPTDDSKSTLVTELDAILGEAQTFSHHVMGIEYGDSRIYYGIFVKSEAGNYSQVMQSAARPDDTTAPLQVTSMNVTAQSGGLKLQWNPRGDVDLDGYILFFKERDGDPVFPYTGYVTKNVQISTESVQAYTILGLSNGVTYNIVLQPYDLNGNTGNVAIIQGIPTANLP